MHSAQSLCKVFLDPTEKVVSVYMFTYFLLIELFQVLLVRLIHQFDY